MNLKTLRALGFDRARRTGRGTYRVECSQCLTLIINGMSLHEHGCPNAARAGALLLRAARAAKVAS